MTPDRYLEDLSPGECLTLLGSVPVGWVGYCDQDRPHLVPVNFVLHLDEVVFRSRYGAKLTAAAQGRVMTFGASEHDEASRTGWSVVVTGASRLLGNGMVNPDVPDPNAWPLGHEGVLVAIAVEEVTGRRMQPES